MGSISFFSAVHFNRDFKVIELIGQGSFGNVYKAIHLSSGEAYAVKEMRVVGNQLEEMMIETEILRQCKSPYIISYFGSFIRESNFLIIMEYCSVGSVRDVMELLRKPLSEQQTVCIGNSVLHALAYLHGHRKIHRDIKTENILLNHKGEAKLADFGVSRTLGSTLSKRHTTIGTPYYIAPEVIERDSGGYGNKADIWSLGITLLECVEMYPPHYEMDPMRALFLIPTLPSPSLKSPHIFSSRFNDFLNRCLIKDPDHRASANELLQHSLMSEDFPKFSGVVWNLVEEASHVVKETGGSFLSAVKNSRRRSQSMKIMEFFDDPPKEDQLWSSINSKFQVERDKLSRKIDPRQTWYWIPHPTLLYVPGVILSCSNSQYIAKTEEGEEIRFESATPPISTALDSSSLVEIQDLTCIHNFDEKSLLHCVRQRYYNNHFYTFVGSILVFVNPHIALPLYHPEMMQLYSGKDLGDLHNPSHVFAMAELAYSSLRRESKDQSIIIGGESGSGKTENCRQILSYLTFVSKSQGSSKDNLESKILEANIILEAFGNAKTIRNDNSSRFGKFVKVHFSENGRMTGAIIHNYLLEKSRVVQQGYGERNYHIFYHMLTLQKDNQKALILHHPQYFHYLNQSQCVHLSTVNDADRLYAVMKAMNTLGLDPKQQVSIFQILNAILHLGNVTFKQSTEKSETSQIDNDQALKNCATLLHVNPAKLSEVLIQRNIAARNNKSHYAVALRVDQAVDARDALAKALYHSLFEYLVSRINISLSQDHDNYHFIGLLDIFGFEVFQKNSLEQLCINYCNEKLQQFFEERIFIDAIDECRKEGIHIPFNRSNTNNALSLIEKKPDGIIALLDEQCLFPASTDLILVEKYHQSHHGNSSFVSKKKRQTLTEFSVLHFAGEVTYDGFGFLEKNRDTVYQDFVSLMETSEDPLVQILLGAFKLKVQVENVTEVRSHRQMGASRKTDTLCLKFKDQLNQLVSTLKNTEPHFVRCINPNLLKEPENFDSRNVLEQMRYLGILDAIKVGHCGFPIRRTFQDFSSRYGLLVTLNFSSPLEMCQHIMTSLSVQSGEYRFGTSQVFLKETQYRIFENLRERKLENSARTLQHHIKCYILRKEYHQMRESTILIQCHIRSLLSSHTYRTEKEKWLQKQAELRIQQLILEKSHVDADSDPMSTSPRSDTCQNVTKMDEVEGSSGDSASCSSEYFSEEDEELEREKANEKKIHDQLLEESNITCEDWTACARTMTNLIQSGHLDQEYKALNVGESRKGRNLFSDSLEMYNMSKNRWMDILPFNHSRVKLLNAPSILPGSDYINASWIKMGPANYIAAQAPLPSTFTDWYQMIWECNVVVIIMLSKLVERGRIKADDYMPRDGSEMFGELRVDLLQEHDHGCFVQRCLKIVRGDQTRYLDQFHYTLWPDHGVPDPGPILEMMTKVHKMEPPATEKPIIVHCSAGIGRSGTYIAIETLLDEIDKKFQRKLPPPTLNIMKLVEDMREQRSGMVQTIDQYRFVYKTVSAHIFKLIRGMHEAPSHDESDELEQNRKAKVMRQSTEIFENPEFSVSRAGINGMLVNMKVSDSNIPVAPTDENSTKIQEESVMEDLTSKEEVEDQLEFKLKSPMKRSSSTNSNLNSSRESFRSSSSASPRPWYRNTGSVSFSALPDELLLDHGEFEEEFPVVSPEFSPETPRTDPGVFEVSEKLPSSDDEEMISPRRKWNLRFDQWGMRYEPGSITRRHSAGSESEANFKLKSSISSPASISSPKRNKEDGLSRVYKLLKSVRAKKGKSRERSKTDGLRKTDPPYPASLPDSLPEPKTRRWTFMSPKLPPNSPVILSRAELISQFLAAERLYLEDLRTLISVFKMPLQKGNVVPISEVELMFQNVEQILAINESFYIDLEQDTSPTETAPNFARIFHSTIKDFAAYVPYCVNEVSAINMINICRKKYDLFDTFCRYCASKPECHNKDIVEFTLAPVKRLCEYVTFLRRLEILSEEKEKDEEVRAVQLLMSGMLSEIEDHVQRQRRKSILQKVRNI
eukprot:TRINITY_DN668_c1_g1_i1.p1 TRINITY_DN668_c1_g1~~TRINITY_DN668_c1_g1_i1.p1  ORF type:complete len:2026 (-),score=563.43 TRINITY_DN668_c1_g1_i1:45-6122(-)